jgi:hypothetical protein
VKTITIAIPEHAAERLAELARRQYRAPRQQAAVMLLEAIERAAETPTERTARERREAVAQ